MKLFELFKKVKVRNKLEKNLEISSICNNSLEATKNSLFFAVKGNNLDGYNFIPSAVENGAVCIVTDRLYPINCMQILVDDVLSVMALVAYRFYKPKNKRVKLIGVVGTNGKTTTSFILKHVLNTAGIKTGVIGTLGVYFNNSYIAPELTTPDSINLAEILMKMADDNIEYCVMEISAHAISLKRINALYFEYVIFTNCTQDHLDYFSNFEDYEKCKMSVFIKKYCKNSILNVDSKTGLKLLKKTNCNSYTYGLNNPSDAFAINFKNKVNGSKFVMNIFDEIINVSFPMNGIFNVYNTLSASTVASIIGVSPCVIKLALSTFKCVPGRMEFIEEFNGANVFVDYAHTPDGLENTLKSLKELCKNRLILVFGCGGNRDKSKRQVMGEVAGRYADFTIITSDNPRYEEPYKIICEIENGIRKITSSYITIQNRYIAIGYGVEMLKKGDILVVCGKGAEEYQEIMGVKLKYSDKDTIRDVIAKIGFSGELV